MKHIYYLIGFVFLINKIAWILNPKTNTKRIKRYNIEYKKNKGKKWEDMSNEYKDLVKLLGVKQLIIWFWLLAGMFTFNWVLFIAFIMFNLIVGLIGKPFRFNMIYTSIHWVNSIIGFAFCIFVIINSYHLKIDLYELIIKYFNQ
jgi:hypothetical protein